jgi:hypothetical protein
MHLPEESHDCAPLGGYREDWASAELRRLQQSELGMIPANQRLDARHRRRTAGRELGLVVEGEFLLIESMAELRRSSSLATCK